MFKYNSYKEWNNEYRICVEPEQQFYDILKTEKMPFRDFISKKPLKDVYNLEFRSEKDRYAMRQENGRNISLIMIPDLMKVSLHNIHLS